MIKSIKTIKITIVACLFTSSQFCNAQVVEIQGKLKVNTIHQDSNSNEVLIVSHDGTLSKISLSKLTGSLNEVVMSTQFYNPKLNELGYVNIGNWIFSNHYNNQIDSGQWSREFTFDNFPQRSYASIASGKSSLYIFGGLLTGGTHINSGLMKINSTEALLPTLNAPSPRKQAFAFVNINKEVHTFENYPLLYEAPTLKEKLIIYGGTSDNGYLNDGSVYDKDSNTWTPMSLNNAPSDVSLMTAVWADSVMITFRLNSLKKYNPYLNNWTELATCPEIRIGHTMVYTGNDLLIWGGYDLSGNYLSNVLKYNINSNSWISVNAPNYPILRQDHNAVWIGNEMVILGGWDQVNYLSGGARFNPIKEKWTALPTTNAPSPRNGSVMLWSGRDVFVYGGISSTFEILNNGAQYNPITDKWHPISNFNKPQPLIGFSAAIQRQPESSNIIFFGGNQNGVTTLAHKYLGTTNTSPILVYLFKKVK